MINLARFDAIGERSSGGLTNINSQFLAMLGKRIKSIEKSNLSAAEQRIAVQKELDKFSKELNREGKKAAVDAEETFRAAAVKANEIPAGAAIGFAQKAMSSGELEQIVNAVSSVTRGTFYNLGRTNVAGIRIADVSGRVFFESLSQTYNRIVDDAISRVIMGTTSYQAEVRRGLKEVADSGIRIVDYESGYSRRMDSALRQNITDGVRSIAEQISAENGRKFGADGVEIDAHNYCAPDHLPFQGRMFSNEEYAKIEEKLKRQFMTWNCRHTVYPVILGVNPPLYTEEQRQAMYENSTRKFTFEGKEYTGYEGTQLQRRLETEIRKSKDRAVLFAASGDDTQRRVEQTRINALKHKYMDVSKTFSLPYASERMSVPGFRAVSPKIPGDRKTIGFSFLSGDTNLKSTQDALDLGNSVEGWEKHEQIFRQNYLKPFNLKDDVTKTIGYWGGPEPSFNASVSGGREDFLAMAKQWGKDYNQQAMAVLLPDKRSSGGKVMFNLGAQLTPKQWDRFFQELTQANESLVQNPDDYIGVTTKMGKSVEYWFGNATQRENAVLVFRKALAESGVKAEVNSEGGYLFRLLFAGSDY